ncbi:type II secretion system F family protein [Paraburkholderia domus]|uniref:type II secretion system F family protein n=1 Tax=Paraburkholderia domus TaxID=2793075 RepID=UPI00191236B4|nr:type II secretion system F family protein [Paraburkholderia domus]MBK5064804.1 type II secretion system F family protein [Burkholderia sp. R-70199]CAE6956592.1 Toxin coregulated pilus biosynthesis protein E [Paraburkholderia domus]
MADISWSLRKKFYEQASTQIENGLGLTKVLGDFRDRLTRRGRKKAGAAFHQVYRRVEDGKTLTEALGRKITDLERTVISAGEKAGSIPRSMRLVLDVREMTARMIGQLRSSFFAPGVYMLAMYLVLFIIGDYIVPQFTAAVPVKKWTGWAYTMYQMGDLATSWKTPIVFGGIAAYAVWALWASSRWTGAGRTFCDERIFPFTTYREVAGFSWLLSFGALLQAGVADTVALKGQIGNSSPWLASRLRPILHHLEDGRDLATAMRMSGHGFPSPELIDDISAYVGFPNFPEMIEKVSRQYAKTLEKQLIARGAMISFLFSMVMFGAMVVLQLGANSISTILTANMSHG